MQARSFVWGIKAVVVDYAKTASSESSNWCVVGFASGTADRDQAACAIELAARKYATWVMVDDADPRADEAIDNIIPVEGA